MGSVIDRRTAHRLRPVAAMCHTLETCHAVEEVWRTLVETTASFPGVAGAALLQRATGENGLAVLASVPETLAVPRPAALPWLRIGEPQGGAARIRRLASSELWLDQLGAAAGLYVPIQTPAPLARGLFLWLARELAPLEPDLEDALFVAASLASARAEWLQLRAEMERLQHHLEEDSLTGVKNRAFALQSLSREIALAERRRSPLALVLLDIDNFKKFNDTYGHLAGDRVLREVARVLKRTARCGDIVSRYGGEEFLLVLPDTTLENAHLFAERLRGAIERYGRRLTRHFPNLALTISLGVTSVSVFTDEVNDAIARADKALYASKANGRNQVNVGPAPHQLEERADVEPGEDP
ncbi:MAG: GGDEF domain-containing protein [Planctomycetota bacterium]